MYIDYEDEFCMANADELDDLNVQEQSLCKKIIMVTNHKTIQKN